MTDMTNPERLEHLDGLWRVKGFPDNDDSAVRAVVRYFADGGVVCTDDEGRQIVADRRGCLNSVQRGGVMMGGAGVLSRKSSALMIGGGSRTVPSRRLTS